MANANVILGSDYQSIATAYGNMKHRLDGAATYLYSAVNTIVLMNTLDPTVDLLSQFYNAYLVNSGSVNNIQPFLTAVKALNNHILARGGYTSIGATGDPTSYLVDVSLNENGGHPLTVPQGWADLSTAAGQSLSAIYIVANTN